SEEARGVVEQIARLLEPLGAGNITPDGRAADIGPLMDEGVPGMSLKVDGTRYFWYHHTNADTMDKLDPHELNLCVAAMAIVAYVVADMPEALPR
ncbi:MAG: M28 family peptidase, partial [Fidelibacterota bacterium]